MIIIIILATETLIPSLKHTLKGPNFFELSSMFVSHNRNIDMFFVNEADIHIIIVLGSSFMEK